MAPPVIALLTDFGTRDHYVGTMKGVVLGICPEATLVDISHEVPAQDVAAAALELAACYRYFPSGTIFLVVVDPGVGTPRRPLAARAGGYLFVAPDNGVLSGVFDATPPERIVTLAEPRYALARQGPGGRTFDGRDRFAPAAAWLARGVALADFGPDVETPERLVAAVPRIDAGRIAGVVVRVDRFGNLITNVERGQIERLAGAGALQVHAGGRVLEGVVDAYGDVPQGAACALIGSTGQLELAVNGGSAAAVFGLGRGSPVHVARGA